jgi:uncharacterized protein (TIGR02145 family)
VVYNCNPRELSTSPITSITASGKTNTHGLTWVPVVCGTGSTVLNVKCEASTGWSANSRSGYAVYTDADWAANSTYTADLTAEAAKEPLLFFPDAAVRIYFSTLSNECQYWTSTPSGSDGALYMELTNTRVRFAATNFYRGNGHSVRCVAEN